MPDYQDINKMQQEFAESLKKWLTIDVILAHQQFVLIMIHQTDQHVAKDQLEQLGHWRQTVSQWLAAPKYISNNYMKSDDYTKNKEQENHKKERTNKEQRFKRRLSQI